MSITELQVLGPAAGETVIPRLDDYDDASEGWTETEFRATTSGDAVVGYWEGRPGWVRIDDWPYTEVCVIRSGHVEIEDSRGSVRGFGPGDAFVVPKGFQGTWRTLDHCEKVFVGIPC